MKIYSQPRPTLAQALMQMARTVCGLTEEESKVITNINVDGNGHMVVSYHLMENGKPKLKVSTIDNGILALTTAEPIVVQKEGFIQ